MARSRNIKPAFFINEVLAGLPHWTRLLFAGLWTIADRDGRLEDNPRRIGAALFPYESGLQIHDGLSMLDGAGFIKRYAVAGLGYVQILSWDKHQNPHPKEAKSVIPPFISEASHEKPRLVTEMPRRVPEIPELAGLIPDSLNLIPDSLNPEPRHEPLASVTEDPDRPKQAFEEFIGKYPNKIRVDEACRQWITMLGSDITGETLPEVMAGLQRWLDSEQWAKENGRYIPAPTKWLREKLWRDHPPQSQEAIQSAKPKRSNRGTDPNAVWVPDWEEKIEEDAA